MKLGESRRIERNQRSMKKAKRWRRVYRSRMDAGLEACRVPDCPRRATAFAHIVPYSKGGRFARDNLALLCRPCDREQGVEIWDWLPSLLDDPEYDRKMAQGVIRQA